MAKTPARKTAATQTKKRTEKTAAPAPAARTKRK